MNYNNATNYFQERGEYAIPKKTSIKKIGKSNGIVLPKAWVDYYRDRIKNLVLLD